LGYLSEQQLDLSKDIWAIPAGLLAWTIDG